MIPQLNSVGPLGFGNMLFKYCAARGYAEKIGAVLETCPWAGDRIFKVNHNPAKTVYPLDQNYYQDQESIDLYTRSKVKAWLNLNDTYQTMYDAITVKPVVAHLRRQHRSAESNYAQVHRAVYTKAAKHLGYSESDIEWVTDGDGSNIHPPSDGRDLSFVPDFLRLMKAKVLLRANSTFSWWAAVLGDSKVYSPVVGDRTGWIECEFVEGNHLKMTPGFPDLYLKP